MISYKLLGTAEWFVIHHSDCGMEFFTNEVIRDLLSSSLETAQLGPDGFTDVGEGPGSDAAQDIDFLTIEDNAASVTEDVRADPQPPAGARAHPDLRLHLRRQDRPARRGARSHQGRGGDLTRVARRGAARQPASWSIRPARSRSLAVMPPSECVDSVNVSVV